MPKKDEQQMMKNYVRSKEEEEAMGNPAAGRFTQGKIRYDLIAPYSLEQLAKVYTYGTIKYDDDNWWKGLKWKAEVFGCITRHIWKWFRGEKNDDESGLHHLAHAAWNCFALMEYERCGLGIDDRCPYVLDLMEPEEQKKRIAKWRSLADQGKDTEYNGLDVSNN